MVIIAVIAHHAGWVPGTVGVVVFFVLSGFLITSSLLNEWTRSGAVRLKAFYWRRIVRLIPALLLLLLGYTLYAALTQTPEDRTNNFVMALLVLSNLGNWVQAFSAHEALGALNHTWSLSVQEQFYLFWPLALVFMLRKRWSRGAIATTVLAGALVSVLLRAFLWQGPATLMRVYFGGDTRADALLVGCLVACLVSWKVLPQSRFLRALFAAVATISILSLAYLQGCTNREDAWLYRSGFAIAAVLTAAIVLHLEISRGGAMTWLLERPALVWIGQISYGLYLWHYPFLKMTTALPLSTVVSQFVWIVLSVSMGAASYYLVEMPLIRARKRGGATSPARAT